MTHAAAGSDRTLAQRIERLEARAAIRALVGTYCITVDVRDLDGIAQCFTRNGIMRSADGVMNASGREAVIAQFHGRFAVLGPSNHFTHDHIIQFDDQDANIASGSLNTHAELIRNGEMLVASLRYRDRYQYEEGRWRFAERVLSFFYYARPGELPEVLGSALRNRAYPEPMAADFPEESPFWSAYYRERPRKR
ncbi:MAG: nuclear transport factor 2 family protein [Pseudomonadota bacterium]